MNTQTIFTKRLAVLSIVASAIALTAALTLATTPAHALGKGQVFTTQGNTYKVIDYDVDDDDPPEVALVKYGATSKKPIIDSVTYKGVVFEVEKIGKGAFNNRAGHKITKIAIGRNVDEIGAKAFFGCKRLKSIDMRSCECVDLDRIGGSYVIDDLDIGKGAFSKCGVKRVIVKCGRSDKAYRNVYKQALVSRGLRSSARVVS